MFLQEVFQILPIEQVFFVVKQWVGVGSEDIVVGSQRLFNCLRASSSEEASFNSLASKRVRSFFPRSSRSNFNLRTSVKVELFTMGRRFT